MGKRSDQRTLTVGGSFTVQLVSSLTRLKLTSEGNIILFVFSEAVYCNLVKLETNCTVMLPPTVSVLWSDMTLPRSLSFIHSTFLLMTDMYETSLKYLAYFSNVIFKITFCHFAVLCQFGLSLCRLFFTGSPPSFLTIIL